MTKENDKKIPVRSPADGEDKMFRQREEAYFCSIFLPFTMTTPL